MDEEKIGNKEENTSTGMVEESPWASAKHASPEKPKVKGKKRLSKKAKIIIGVVVGLLCVLSVAGAAL